MRRTLLLMTVLAWGAAQAAPVPDLQPRSPAPAPVAERLRSDFAQLEREGTPAADPARRADDCAEQARRQQLQGDDYRIHMIRCLHR